MKKKFNIIQIWIEAPKVPSERVIGWMKSIIEKKPESSTYTLISTRNYLKSIKEVKWVNVNSYLEQMKSNHPLINKIFDKISIHNKSELLRSYLPSIKGNGNIFYFDCDVQLKNWPEKLPNTKKPIFVKRGHYTFDNHCFYVNGNTEVLRIMTNKMAEEMHRYLTRFDKPAYSSAYKVINRMKDSVEIIDDKFMIHHYSG